MLLHEKVQRAGALGPYGLVAVHVGEIHERVFLRTSPPGLAVSAIDPEPHQLGVAPLTIIPVIQLFDNHQRNTLASLHRGKVLRKLLPA